MEQNQLEAYCCSEAVVFNYVHAYLMTILTNRKDVGAGFHRHDEDTQYENGDGCSDESEIESGTLGFAPSLKGNMSCYYSEVLLKG
ncbi:hypothetical protein EMCRGX_G029065 [Ephydatia muelleri]